MKPTLLLVPLAFFAACTPAPKSGGTSDAHPAAMTSAAPSASADAPVRAVETITTSGGPLAITPIYHASMFIQYGGKTIAIDPFSKGDLRGLPKADYVILTDIHFDHLDAAALDVVAGPSTLFIVPKAVADQMPDKWKGTNVEVMKNGDTKDYRLFKAEAIPMYNIERGPEPGKLFHDKGRGNGYVLTFGDKRIYVSGDTECTPEMKALKNIDAAFVCMNLPYTMPPKEAAACINAFKPKVVYPYHYAVPGGASSNLDELKSAIDPKAGVEVRVLKWY